jgi:outer membrane receptor for ferrienterochelin and colicins
VLDANASYQINDSLKLSIGIDNVLGERTPINWSGTGQIEDPPGRFVYLSLRFAQ